MTDFNPEIDPEKLDDFETEHEEIDVGEIGEVKIEAEDTK